ncbi:MAG: DNA-directed RNA polymerase subunit N [Candidatus Hodarchaeales archaeon]|jgi:DNA-directed RNA polymerase subunit N
MLIQVRCYTCGKVVGHLHEPFKRRVESGENGEKVLDSLGLKRYCCRRMLITHVDILEETIKFSTASRK